MLKAMRAKGNNMVVWIILGLLMIGLTGFGIGGVGGTGGRSIGSVGDESISVDDYARALQQEMRSLSAQIGQTVTFAQAQQFGMDRQVMQRLVTSTALDDEANKLGISVGDETVLAELLQTPAFQGLDGSFDKEAYEFALERARLSPSEYEALVREESARTLVQAGIVSGISADQTAAETVLGYTSETRDFDWVSISKEALTLPTADPTVAQLEAQYAATPAAYTAPLTREITYVSLTPDMLLNHVEVSEEQLMDSYELQSDRFNRPALRAVDRLVFGSMAEAEEARNQLDSSILSFDELVEKRGLSPQDAQLGEVQKGSLSSAAADLVFAAQEPGVLGPVQTDLGPALFRVNAVINEEITPFEEARDEIYAELAGEQARRSVSDRINDIDDLLASGATLEELAEETDMERGRISFTDTSEDGIAGYEEFRKIASETKVSDFAEINDLSDGGVFALRVDEIKQPALRPLAEVEDQVKQDWLRVENLKRIQELATDLKQQMDSGQSFAALNQEPNSETGVTRTGFIENTPPALVTEIFAASPGEVVIVADNEDVFIGQLKSITAFDPHSEENTALMEMVKQQIDGQLSSDVFSLFATALQNEKGVTLNQAAVNSIHSQIQ